MSEYVISAGQRDYVCNGSYIVRYERYKVLGTIHEARRFKSRKAAESALDKIRERYVNLNECEIMEVKE